MELPRPLRRPRKDLARAARIRYTGLAHYASVYARGLVPDACDEHLQPGELKRCADRLAVMAEAIQRYAVYFEISAHGWAAAARGDGYTEGDYRDIYCDEYDAWLGGDAYPWIPPFVDRATMPPLAGGNLEQVMAGLQAWYARTTPVTEPVDPPTA